MTDFSGIWLYFAILIVGFIAGCAFMSFADQRYIEDEPKSDKHHTPYQ